MASPWSSCTKPREGFFGNQIAPTSTSSSSANDQYCGYDEVKLKTLFGKMIWELGLACFLPPRWRGKEQSNNTSEHNKAWLLAESGGVDGDPHSSFRYSFCSQVEVESMNVANPSPATVLMVNLDNGLVDSRELKCRRIESLERALSPVAGTLVRFSYAQILSATRNFSRGRFLGRGALSCVYRGRIGCLKTAVAIKRLVKEDKECWKSFCRELMIASSLHSPNIVPLVGFCIDPEEGLFLIYKYVSGGSLEKHLHGEMGVKGVPSLPWTVRYKIAVGIAEAVDYLHSGTNRCIIHRDIKPSNILLTSKKSPKVCDFGLATWTPAPSTPFLCKTVKGTFGYLAPEYFQHGKVSDKTDVFALGVVLLELITGRKPIEAKSGPGEENLVAWAKPLLQQHAIERLLDPRLKFISPRNPNQITWLVQAADACISREESRRPGIREIVAMLRGEEPNCSNNKKSSSRNGGYVVDCESQSQQTRSVSEMKSHLALAMLGVSEFGEDDHLYSR
ncbi:probable serine/threonine-protein kinase PBL7 [Diospyros lotus]|uniref:probable serine/threonine-protein kinase PBL7 n=1 Tax=Diospyros lotus TaxID=55363 RepID=UPI002250856D|nr:probable serine/threonine-protein kinase PBL7 [Diospyros lotus]